jgi:hypothetical protein
MERPYFFDPPSPFWNKEPYNLMIKIYNVYETKQIDNSPPPEIMINENASDSDFYFNVPEFNSWIFFKIS